MMDEITLEALKGSIEKWEKIVAGTGIDQGSKNCPLCKVFLEPDPPGENYCDGCPVKEKTGLKLCYGTPYEKWLYCDTKNVAEKELEFLKELLPTADEPNDAQA
jgi:hypothetical protein